MSVQIHESPPVLEITLAVPPVNVIDGAMMNELLQVLTPLPEAGDRLRYVVLKSGVPGRFSAGVSVPEHEPARAPEMIRTFHRLIRTWLRLPQQTLALVQGYAYGGAAEWLLVCDRVFITPDSPLGFPEIKLGFFPPVAMAVLPEFLPPPLAHRMILSGATPPAEEWARMGWPLDLVPAGAMDSALQSFLEEQEGYSHAVVRLAHATLKSAYASGLEARLEEIERVFIDDLLALEDPAEGVRAFLEKRAPQWRHA